MGGICYHPDGSFALMAFPPKALLKITPAAAALLKSRRRRRRRRLRRSAARRRRQCLARINGVSTIEFANGRLRSTCNSTTAASRASGLATSFGRRPRRLLPTLASDSTSGTATTQTTRTKVPLAVGGGRLRRQGPGWKPPSRAQADAFLDALTPDQEDEWLPLIGNGGTQCQQMQQGGNGVWWLEDNQIGVPNCAPMCGGASIFCNTGSCYTTGTQMGDAYLYRVRCVRTITDNRRNINAATSEDLRAIQGIGKERAALVLGGVPYFAANDEQFEAQLLRIDGVGQKTTDKVVAAYYAPGLGECPKKVDASVCDVENDRGAPTFDACDPTDPCCTHADVADAEWCQRNCEDDYCPRSHCRCIPQPERRGGLLPNFRLDCGSGCACHLSPGGWPIVATVANCRQVPAYKGVRRLRFRERQYQLPPLLRQVGKCGRCVGLDQSDDLGSL